MKTQRILSLIIAISFFAIACDSRSVGNNDNLNENLNNNQNQVQSSLLVTLHESSPTADIPEWEPDVVITVYAFTAVGDKDIPVNNSTLTRIGPEGWDYDGLKLMIDGVVISGWNHFDSETNEETFSDSFTIPAGETILVELHAWVDSEPNRTNKICIMQPSHLNASYVGSNEEVTIIGDFPVCSHELTTYALPVGTVHYTVLDASGRMPIMPGEQDVLALSVILEGEDRDSIMYYMDFYETQQEMWEAYSNARLYLDGVLREPSHEIRIDGNWIGFIFEDHPIFVPNDATVLMELVVDYDADIPACTHFSFDLSEDYPFYAVDAEYPVQANVVETLESITPYPDYITGDQVAAALDPDNPPMADITAGSTNVEFLMWYFSCQASGPVWWFDLDIVLQNGATLSDLDNLKVWRWIEGSGTWYQHQLVHDPIEAVCIGNRCTLTLEAVNTNVVEFSGCRNTRYKITMDVLPSAASGATFHVELDTTTILADIFPYTTPPNFTSGVLAGNEMTVVP